MYCVDGHPLKEVESQKESKWCYYFKRSETLDLQRANQRLGMISRSFTDRSRNPSIVFCTMARPVLEMNSPVWNRWLHIVPVCFCAHFTQTQVICIGIIHYKENETRSRQSIPVLI